MTIWTVPGSGYAQLIINAGDGPTMVINRDTTHQLFIGNDNSVASKNGTGDIDIIDPLSYIVYSGIQNKYAISDTPGVTITVDTVQGATNWAPSPAQAAAQINALGLAKDSSVNNPAYGPAKDTTVAATETAVNTVNTTLGAPPQNASIINANPYFASGSLASWSPNQSTATILNSIQAVAGCPGPYAAKITPNGVATFSTLTSSGFFVAPNQQVQARMGICLQFTDANIINAVIILKFYNAANVNIQQNTLRFNVPGPNTWQWLNIGSGVTAPANTVYATVDIGIFGTANISASDIFQVSVLPVFSPTNQPGILSQDDTIGRLHDHIAVTGSPLLHGYNVLQAPGSFQTTGAGATTTYTYPISKPGYIIQFNGGISGASTFPFYKVRMLWQDAATNNNLCEEVWYLPANTTTNLQIFGKGPTKGNQLNISIINLDITNALNLFWSLEETTQHIARDDWRGDVPINVPTFTTAPGADPFDLILLATGNINVPASATDTWIMPVFSGPCYIYSQITPAAQNTTFTISVARTGAQLYQVIATPTAQQINNTALITLPREPCLVRLANTNTAPTPAQVSIIAQEFVS